MTLNAIYNKEYNISKSGGQLMNGRTYCGHYKGHYLKSTLEYIYARFLDYMTVSWDYEVKTFALSDGKTYKPDFYIAADNSFVEIKGSFNFLTDKPKVDQFRSETGLAVIMLQESDLRQLIGTTNLVFAELQREWKLIAKSFGMDLSGKNNPRYGVVVSDRTKDKIRVAANQRLLNPVYRAKFVKAISQRQKQPDNILRLQAMADSKKLPPVFMVCEYCKNTFELQVRSRKTTRFCSYECSNTVLHSKSHNSVQLLEIAKSYAKANSQNILSCKMNRIESVLNGFYDVALSETGIKDKRTLTKYLVGSKGTRKDMIRYFQSLVENVLGTLANNEAKEIEDKEPLC